MSILFLKQRLPLLLVGILSKRSMLCNAVLEDPDPSKLIWRDEFDVDGAPNPAKWSYDLGDGCNIGLCNWGNGEVAYYTNSPGNIKVSNGVLSITAKKESGFTLPYTSARLVTRDLESFKYGRIQFRASLEKCKALGTWPALWMLPEEKVYGGWPNSGEIDVMEAVGHDSDRFFGTVHTASYNGMIGTQKGSSINRSTDDWHTFEIDWRQDRIFFAVDGQIYFEYPRGASIDWPFDQEFHLIMNIAVGGSWGGQQGIDEASFEGEGQVMQVDWIRVYANEYQPQPTQQPTAPSPNQVVYCGCNSCNRQVWNTVATDGDGNFTCGARITWLQSAQGYSEAGACAQVASEFPDLCTCDPTSCSAPTIPPASAKPTTMPTIQPTKTPTPAPSQPPSRAPSKRPTLSPSNLPSSSPTSRPTTSVPSKQLTEPPSNQATYCGCSSCNQQVWNTMAVDGDGNFSCGARITWLQSAQGYSKAGACAQVASEFPNLCLCDPASCSAPTPTPTTSPSNKPTAPPIVTYCGCESCTQGIWDSTATDGGGNYSCGARITWLQSAEGHSEASACEKVSTEFPDNICGPFCDPTKCSNLFS